MDIPRTIGYTEIVKIAECALNGDSERARVFLKRYIGKYPDKDLVYPFTHLLNGVTNPSGLNSNIIPACEGKADSTSEKDLRVCEVINSVLSAPQWFPEDKRKLALQIWNQHETGDNKRVQVVKLIKEWAADEEYVISFKKAYELFQQHCL